jgi:adenosylhomocysteine nucleosidase
MVAHLAKPLLLVVPTRSEISAVRAAVADRVAGGSVRLVLCGMGPACVSALSHRVEGLGPVDAILLLGWAGGLDPELRAGDVVVADAAVNHQGERLPLPVLDLPGARVGTLLTVPEPLVTPEAKHDAWRRGALAVEMEAYPLAMWAATRELPLYHARVILDAAHEALPDLGDALDAYGRVRPIRLARRLMARPRAAVSLPALARRVREVAPVLRSLAHAAAGAWST